MIAAIDIGTNSIRMLLGTCRGRQVDVHRQFVRETRLGQDMAGRILLPEAISRTLAALKDFQEIIRREGTGQPRVIATSAVRDALNREDFCRQVTGETGWPVQVLSGQEEALLSYRGALSLEPLPPGQPVVIDIGGGSTEVICAADGPVVGRSVNIGAVRLLEKPLTESELQAILTPAIAGIPHPRQEICPIGVGGTATTAAAIRFGIREYSRQAVQGKILTLAELTEMRQQLAAMSPAERLQVVGLPAKRVDIIVPGLVILTTLLQMLGAGQMMISDAGILDGVLMEEAGKG